MRLLITGDLQLGAGQELGQGEYGPGSRLHDQQTMLERIWDIASDEAVDAVCVLGDVFHRARPAPHEILAYQGFVRDLLAAGRRVLTLVGNHDIRSAALPSALELFGEHGSVVALQPSLVPLGDLVIAVLPWVPLSRLVAERGRPDDLNLVAAEQLVATVQGLKADCDRLHAGAPAVLFGHWAVSGGTLPTGLPTGMLREPVLPLEELAGSGFALVLMGHIHATGMLAAGPTPVGFCGSPWLCDWGELAVPHGVWVYDSAGAGALRFVPVEDPRRFVSVEPQFAETAAMGRESEFTMTFGGQMPALKDAVVRVKFTVSEQVMARLDLHAIRKTFTDQGAERVIFRPTVERAVRARVAELGSDGVGDTEALELWLRSQGVNGDLAERMRKAHVSYLERLA